MVLTGAARQYHAQETMPMRLPVLALLAFPFLFFCLSIPAGGHPHIRDLARGQEVAATDFIAALQEVQLVFVGENHDHDGHHAMQAAIIRALKERAPERNALAVGLEMFQADFQWALDKWVAGDLTEADFQPLYARNWSMWPTYRPIFLLAHDRGVPLLGLNISRDLTRQVARHGFASLNAEQRRGLHGIVCRVDPAYENFIRRALGGHGHGDRDFTHFCEAQLLWDAAMARNLLQFLEKNPETQVVVLAGSGHSWKYGIPHQISQHAEISYRVVLPEVRGRIDRDSATAADADFLWLDAGDDGWLLP
ncbi:MAG: ChaN family lipoprotein [Thermodesulfobacteriota bacterium]